MPKRGHEDRVRTRSRNKSCPVMLTWTCVGLSISGRLASAVLQVASIGAAFCRRLRDDLTAFLKPIRPSVGRAVSIDVGRTRPCSAKSAPHERWSSIVSGRIKGRPGVSPALVRIENNPKRGGRTNPCAFARRSISGPREGWAAGRAVAPARDLHIRRTPRTWSTR